MVLDTEETGDTIDRESYQQALPDLRMELINIQYELQHADFPGTSESHGCKSP